MLFWVLNSKFGLFNCFVCSDWAWPACTSNRTFFKIVFKLSQNQSVAMRVQIEIGWTFVCKIDRGFWFSESVIFCNALSSSWWPKCTRSTFCAFFATLLFGSFLGATKKCQSKMSHCLRSRTSGFFVFFFFDHKVTAVIPAEFELLFLSAFCSNQMGFQVMQIFLSCQDKKNVLFSQDYLNYDEFR